MPMSAAELRQIIEALYTGIQINPNVGNEAYRESVTRLHEVATTFFIPAADGKYPAFGEKGLTQVMDALDGAMGGINQDRTADIQRLKDIVNVFAQIDVTKGMSLPDAVGALSSVTVRQVSEPSKAGSVSSTRHTYEINLPNGKNMQGYFTEEERFMEYDKDGKLMKYLKDFSAAHKKNANITAFVNNIWNHPAKASALVACMNADYEVPNGLNPKGINAVRAYKSDALIFHDLLSRDELRRYYKDKDFIALLCGFRAQVSNEEAKRGAVHGYQYSRAGVRADLGSSISGRNVAMSRMANLLGIPSICARSQPVSIEVDGKRVKGVFMEKADGHDFPNTSQANDGTPDAIPFENTVFGHADPNGISGKGLASMADLQVLDFICMNCDRHQNNMMYNFDDEGKLTKVVGIDNDLSFGTRPISVNRGVMHGAAFADINVITEKMADRISKLNVNTIATALQEKETGLKPAEIRAVCNRVKSLQNQITLARENQEPLPEKREDMYGKLYIVKDDEWESLQPEKLLSSCVDSSSRDGKPCKNIFYFASGVKKKIREYHANPEDVLMEEAPKSFGATQKVDFLSSSSVMKEMNAIRALSDELAETTRHHGNKQDFKNMQDALNRYLALNVNEKTKMTDDMIEVYRACLKDVVSTANKYVQHKLLDGDTSKTGTKRRDIAQRLSNVASKHYDDFHAAANERLEKQLSENFLEAKAMEEQYDRVFNTIADWLSVKNQDQTREAIEQLIRKNGVLDVMLSDKDALKTLSDMAAKNPDALVQRYGNALNNHIHTGGNQPALKTKTEVKSDIKPKVLG